MKLEEYFSISNTGIAHVLMGKARNVKNCTQLDSNKHHLTAHKCTTKPQGKPHGHPCHEARPHVRLRL